MKSVVFIRSTSIYDDSRATKEIMALAKLGYHVVIIGWDRNGNALKKSQELFSGYNVEYHFFPVQLNSGIGLKNIDKLFKWKIWINRVLKSISNVLLIHACNLDSGFAVYNYCKKNSIPLVYDIYDYYIDSHSIPQMAINLVEKMEIKIINLSNVTVICTEERKEQIAKSNPQKLIIVHNSPDLNCLVFDEEKYDYSYCGSLCDRRLIGEIIEKYNDHTNLKFAFAGNDKYKDFIEKESNKYNNLIFYGTIPYSEVLKIESQTKVLSAIYEPTIRNHRLCAPNKFYESLALAKPVIVCKGTGIDKIVEREQIGVVIDYDANQFFIALNNLLNDESLRNDMGKRARHLYETKYSWKIMEERLIIAYKEIVDKNE